MAKKATPAGKTNSQVVRDILDSGVLKPSEIVQVAKDKYQTTVSKPLINQVKMAWKKKSGAAPKIAKRMKQVRKAGGGAVTVKSEQRGGNGKLSAVDATVLLCEKFGTSQAKAIIDAFQGQ